jgi:hypothetical protein
MPIGTQAQGKRRRLTLILDAHGHGVVEVILWHEVASDEEQTTHAHGASNPIFNLPQLRINFEVVERTWTNLLILHL